MKLAIRKGLSFGVTSGIITTLALIVGLNSSTHSVDVVIGGILVIAIADALSDAMGMHISLESDKKNKSKQIWAATFSTFFSKFFVALTFVLPFLFFSLKNAIIASIIWGLALIIIFNFYLAKRERKNPLKIVIEHVILMTIVIIISYYVGGFIGNFVG